ncbi:MAG: hypothetical protein ABSC23_00445 [Bryobacteraceae bacterium]
MIVAIACVVAIAVIAFVVGVRPRDLPRPEPPSPFVHLDERKAAIYENLRDLQFEYRLGKLSDQDYQTTKKDLQKELAGVLAAVDRVKEQIVAGLPVAPPEVSLPPAEVAASGFVCPSCGSRFDTELKFCGECGKPMKAVQA